MHCVVLTLYSSVAVATTTAFCANTNTIINTIVTSYIFWEVTESSEFWLWDWRKRVKTDRCSLFMFYNCLQCSLFKWYQSSRLLIRPTSIVLIQYLSHTSVDIYIFLIDLHTTLLYIWHYWRTLLLRSDLQRLLIDLFALLSCYSHIAVRSRLTNMTPSRPSPVKLYSRRI